MSAMTEETVMTVKLLSCVIEKLVAGNDPMRANSTGAPRSVTKFHALRPPSIGVHAYLMRIGKYASCSTSCFILSLVYIDRLIQRNNFVIDSLNVHRVLITSVMLAAKFFDDHYFNNAYFAKIGGVRLWKTFNMCETEPPLRLLTAPSSHTRTRTHLSPPFPRSFLSSRYFAQVPCLEMNTLELEFLFLINFSLFVPTDAFHKYRVELHNHFARICPSPDATVAAAKAVNDATNAVAWSRRRVKSAERAALLGPAATTTGSESSSGTAEGTAASAVGTGAPAAAAAAAAGAGAGGGGGGERRGDGGATGGAATASVTIAMEVVEPQRKYCDNHPIGALSAVSTAIRGSAPVAHAPAHPPAVPVQCGPADAETDADADAMVVES